MPGYGARQRKRLRRAKSDPRNQNPESGNYVSSSAASHISDHTPKVQRHVSGPEVAPTVETGAVPSSGDGPDQKGLGGELSEGFAGEGIRDARLRERAIRKGWIKPGPNDEWPLRTNLADIAKISAEKNGDLDVIEKAVFTVLRDMGSDKASTRQTAVKAALTMRAQNLSLRQHDERQDFHERALEARTGQAASGINVNVEGGGGVQIIIPWNGRDKPPPGAIMGSFEEFEAMEAEAEEANTIEGSVVDDE